MSTANHNLLSMGPVLNDQRPSVHSFYRLGRKKMVVMSIASLIGLAVSAYLAFAAYSMSDVAGCGGGGVFDCGHVLHSRWAKVIGVPVSVFAIVTHLCFLSSLWMAQRAGRLAKVVNAIAMLTALAASAAAIYFITLQVFVLKHICSYCMTAHAGGLLIGIMAITSLPVPPRRIVRLSSVALAGVSGLAVIQMTSAEPVKFEIQAYQPSASASEDADRAENGADLLFSPPVDNVSSGDSSVIFASPTSDQQTQTLSNRPFSLLNQSGHSRRLSRISTTVPLVAYSTFIQAADTERADSKLVPINGGTIKLKAKDWPLLGKPDAKHIFVEMFDYTCEHCRSTNKAIETAKKTLGDDLAIVSLPVPMNSDCNTTIQTTNAVHAEACQLAKLSIAVWRVERAAFSQFHQWLFAQNVAPAYAMALEEAKQRVDPVKLTAELNGNMCDQYLARNVELYKRVGKGAIPKLIFKQTTIVGEFTSGSSLASLIQQHTAGQ